jgi:hypothetical protein
MSEHDVGQTKEITDVPVAWEALEDAFENNAPEVHSYLHFDTGEVIRIVDGVADPSMHTRIMNDSRYLRIDPVSSREQYRWMERFIATVEDEELRRRLNIAIDGKGAFRRFKDALMSHPVDRERWFAFRSERLRACMESWLTAHGIKAVERPTWHVPSAEEVTVDGEMPVEPDSGPAPSVPTSTPRLPPKSTRTRGEGERGRLHELVEGLSAHDLEMASAFLEFLGDRRRTAKPSVSKSPVQRPASSAPLAAEGE